MSEEVQFWRLKKVVEMVGLSRAEIYRRIAYGRFPASRRYGDGGSRVFWLSTEIKAWQQSLIGED
jgi:predicted DNA-binding transcriptional regulator AlpA